jgi:hypothetical protein
MTRVWFPAGQDFSLHSCVHPASYSVGTKWLEFEANHSPPCSAEVKNACSYTVTPYICTENLNFNLGGYSFRIIGLQGHTVPYNITKLCVGYTKDISEPHATHRLQVENPWSKTVVLTKWVNMLGFKCFSWLNYSFVTVLWVVAIIGVCYDITRLLEVSGIKVYYEYGCYTITAAGRNHLHFLVLRHHPGTSFKDSYAKYR